MIGTFIGALQNEMLELPYEQHIMDDTFVSHDAERSAEITMVNMYDLKLKPIGFFNNSKHKPDHCIGFVFMDKNDKEGWVSVPKGVFNNWCDDLKKRFPECFAAAPVHNNANKI